MWPEAKGKSKDNKPDKPGKNRATKAKIKAMSKEAAEQMVRAAQEEQAALDALAAQARAETEAEIGLKYDVARQDTTPDAGRPDLIKLPASAGEHNDDKIASVWKSRMMGNIRPAAQEAQSQTGPRQAQELNERARMNAQHEAMINCVDKMFDHFQNLAYDFNQMNPAAELELTWIRPSVTRENISSWHQSAQYISVFTGRISTRHWTLVVRGTFEGISAYIIPADKLLAFTTQPSHYTCAVEFVPFDGGPRGLVFGAEGRPMDEQQLAMTYRALLDTLITVAQENVISGRLNLHGLGIFDGGMPSNQYTGGSDTISPASSNADIDYSAKYKQHMADSQTSSTHSFQSTSNTGEFFQDGDQYKPATSYPPEFSVNNTQGQNQSQSGAFQTPPGQFPSQSGGYSVNQSQSGGFSTSQNQSGSFQTPAPSDDDWKPVARPGRGFSPSLPGAMTDSGTHSPGGNAGTSSPLGAGEPPRQGFSAEALFQSRPGAATPPPGGPVPQSIAQAISQTISQSNPSAAEPPPAPPAKDVPWNFMPTKVDQAQQRGLGTSQSNPTVPGSTGSHYAIPGTANPPAQQAAPALPPLPPLPGAQAIQPPAPPPVVPPVSPLELLGQVDIKSATNTFGYTRPAPPPPLPPRPDSVSTQNAASAPSPSGAPGAQGMQNMQSASSSSVTGDTNVPSESLEFAMPDSLQVTNMAFLIANEPVVTPETPAVSSGFELPQFAQGIQPPATFPTPPAPTPSDTVRLPALEQGSDTASNTAGDVAIPAAFAEVTSAPEVQDTIEPGTTGDAGIATLDPAQPQAFTETLDPAQPQSGAIDAASELSADHMADAGAVAPAPIMETVAPDAAAPQAVAPEAVAYDSTNDQTDALTAAPDAAALVDAAPVADTPVEADTAPAAFSFKQELTRLLATFDKEMEQVAQKGSEAFAKRDLKTAESMIKLAEEIGEIKEWLVQFSEEHSNDLS